MNKIKIPILLYHGIRDCADDAIRDPLYAISAASLEAQLRWLRENGYTSLSIGDLLAGSTPSKNAFILTVDDCCTSAATRICPLLRKYGYRATFFPVAGRIGCDGWVRWTELEEMRGAGMEIGSHSMTHAELSNLSKGELLKELADSRRILEDRLGVPVKALSLPGGYGGPAVETAAKEAGYRAVCCSEFGFAGLPPDPFRLKRFCIRGGDGEALVRRIMERDSPALLPRFAKERGTALCRRLLGRRLYRSLRNRLIPAGAHRTLPRFPPSG